MSFTRKHPIFIAAALLGSFFCIFTIVSFFPAVFPFLDQLWWDNFSIVTDVIGMFGYLLTFVYLMTGINEDRLADRILDKMELRRRLQELDDTPQSVEIPDVVDYSFAIDGLDSTINTLRNFSFSNSADEFEAVKSSLTNGEIDFAIYRTSIAIEILFRDLLVREKIPLIERYTLRWFTEKLEEHSFLTKREKSVIGDFQVVRNRVAHHIPDEDDTQGEEVALLIAMVALTIRNIVVRYEEQNE